MRILAVISGEYGRRHAENIRSHGPEEWEIEIWQAPTALPPLIDDPEDYLPESLPQVDLILSFGEHPGVAELLPEIATRTGARAVIAAIDNEAWLPRGLARQLRGWLEKIGVGCATPKPLCSLTQTHYSIARRQKMEYSAPLISEFARYFGQPELRIAVDQETRRIVSTQVQRDAVCGCARYVSGGLVGLSAGEAEEKAGMLHHHYPCLASMGEDTDYGDTLMHVSGNIIKDDVAMQVKPFKEIRYIVPRGREK